MTVPQSSVKAPPPGGTVVLVDDDVAVVQGLSRLFGAAGYDVEAFCDPRPVLARLPDDRPCCMVLDLCMPGLDGLALMDALVAAHRHPHVVFLTGHGDVPTATAAMKRGAVDFLTKPATRQELLDAVASAIARDAAARAARAALRQVEALLTTLTPREREVCELVAQGMLNKQIAGALGPSEKTVRVHRERALKKLQVGSVAELVRLLDRARAGHAAARLAAPHPFQARVGGVSPPPGSAEHRSPSGSAAAEIAANPRAADIPAHPPIGRELPRG